MLFIPPEIQFIIDTLNKNGFEAYLVGGCVRDMLMDIPPHDYDITTSAPPEAVISLFDKTVPTGIKHGTVTVINGGTAAEVTTYRADGEYSDHRRPENVTFVKSLKEDLARRDFTVNAIAYNKNEGIKDFFGGKEDIKNEILRAVGAPEKRFREDALRILRLFRFASVLGFTPEAETLKAALKCAPLLENISAERISSELRRAVNGKNPIALKPLTDIKGLQFIGIKNPDYSKIVPLQNGGLALFGFLYSSADNLISALEFLKPSNKEKKLYLNILTLLSLPFPSNKEEIKEMLFKTDCISVEKYLYFQNHYFGTHTENTLDLLREILNNNEPYRLSDLKIGGKNLINIGVSGEKIGETLEYLRKLVIVNPELNKKSILIKKAKNLTVTKLV
ncbi:MAG: CCA tRNA nucleotidyltransferase [Acutalibacteraceae bacterium]|nr:CCA tRNA nucleotidyltransferase [Acutalibacteraceae bacterium]